MKPPDEVYQYGPLRLERTGRYVGLSSNWPPGEFEKHIARVKAHKQPFREEITGKVKELISLMADLDPLELVSHLAFNNVFADPETFSESTHQGRESYVEYALSLALSIKEPRFGVHVTEEALERFSSLIKEIFMDLGWYFAMERLDSEDETRNEIRYLALMRYLNIRGDAYPEHHLDLVRDLFKPHDDFLQRQYGFTTEEIISWVELLEQQIIKALHAQFDFFAQVHRMHKIYQRFVDEKGIESFSSLDECLREFDALPEVQKEKLELQKLNQKIDSKLFEIQPNKDLPKGFLELISAGFGENAEFASFVKSPGWPTNDSIIYRRSIIKVNDDYYCFCPQILFRNLISIIEGLIRDKDDKYFRTTYQRRRGKYLVRQAVAYFEQLLPGANCYEELFYDVLNDGELQRAETDALILYDTNLFIIEGKAGALTVPARRGALSRLERHVEKLVDDAYEQGQRVKQFIDSTDKPTFEYEDGSEALSIENKSEFKNVFLINVTLENLGHLSTRLVDLKKLNFIRGKEWPWSVALTDLRVISEVTESPSEFLVYLRRRIKTNDHPEFHSADELDYFMYYLRDGLYFEDKRLKGLSIFGLHAYTERLDRWYDFQAGRVSSGEKPQLEIPEDYKCLVRSLERSGKRMHSEVTTALLDFDVGTMELILEHISKGKERWLADGKNLDLTLEFASTSVGLTLIVSGEDFHKRIRWGISYSLLRKYQLRFKKWILLIVEIHSDGRETYDFRLFDAPWAPDAEREKELASYRERKLKQFFAIHGRPGRNDPCPCNSTLKYKKCCGRASQ